jgi:hypothetical protein
MLRVAVAWKGVLSLRHRNKHQESGNDQKTGPGHNFLHSGNETADSEAPFGAFLDPGNPILKNHGCGDCQKYIHTSRAFRSDWAELVEQDSDSRGRPAQKRQQVSKWISIREPVSESIL